MRRLSDYLFTRGLAQILASAALIVSLSFHPTSQAQTCLVTATAPAFGHYNPSASSTAANGSVNISCTVLGVTPVSVNFSVRLGFSGLANGTQRRMASLGQFLNYNLHCDSNATAASNVWGDGNDGTCIVAGQFTHLLGSSQQQIPVFGRIAGAQYVAAGSYTDNVSVSVLY